MKKSFFLVLFLCGTFLVAQAGPYYVGANHLNNLLRSVEEPIVYDGDPPEGGFPAMPGINSVDGLPDGTPSDGNWEKVKGFTWTGDIAITDYKNDAGVAPNGTTNYRAITSIDWSDDAISYTQKSDVDVVWEQPPYEYFEEDITEPDPDFGTTVEHARKKRRNLLEGNELRFLESLNFSGNQFRSISINGNDLMEISSIDLSNNPTLTFLELKNLPYLATVDVTGCPSVVLNVENCPDAVVIGAPTGTATVPANNIVVSASQGRLLIKGAPNETASVYTADGRLVCRQKLAAGTSSIALANNLYIVRLSNGTVRKAIVK